mgnify:CR=1 FL=1
MTYFTQTEIDNLPPPPGFLLDPIMKEIGDLFNKVLSLGVIEIRPIERALDKVFENPCATILLDALKSTERNYREDSDTYQVPQEILNQRAHVVPSMFTRKWMDAWGMTMLPWITKEEWNKNMERNLPSNKYYAKKFSTKNGNIIHRRVSNFNQLLRLYNRKRHNFIYDNQILSVGDLIDIFVKGRYSFDKACFEMDDKTRVKSWFLLH